MTVAATAVDEGTVRELRRHWEEGWNGYDLATIMAPFAGDVVFSSPFVSKLTGDPARTTVEGYAALEAYVADSLERARGIRYTVDATYVGADTIVLLYTVHRPDGTDQPGADTMRVDAAGKVVEWRCHYTFAFFHPDVRHLVDQTPPQ